METREQYKLDRTELLKRTRKLQSCSLIIYSFAIVKQIHSFEISKLGVLTRILNEIFTLSIA